MSKKHVYFELKICINVFDRISMIKFCRDV